MIFRQLSFVILLTFNGKTMLNININAEKVEKRSIIDNIKSLTFEKVDVRADEIQEIDNLSNLKTSIECAASCVASINCYAFKWNGLECNLLSENGLCLDVQNKNPTSVYADQNDMPLDCVDPTIQVFATNSPTNGPLINGYVSVEANKMYSVKVELMLTDLDGSSEYADITIDGIDFGRCNPSGSQMSCEWYTCTEKQVSTSSSIVSVKVQYGSEVGDLGQCSSDGQIGHGVARITLTP